MNPSSAPNFIPDNQMQDNSPDFIPDNQADKFFGGNSQPQQRGMNLTDNPVGATVNFLAPALKTGYNALADQVDYQNKQPNAKGNLGQAVGNAVNDAEHLAGNLVGTIPDDIGTALSLMGIKSLVGVVKNPDQMVKTVTNAPKYLTKGGLSNITDQAANRATQAGQSMHWDDLMADAKDAVVKKFGDTAVTRQVLNNVLGPRVPAGVESIPETLQQTPNQLLQLRRNILNSYGNNIIQGTNEKGINALEQKVAGIVRGVVSKNLHRIAPETVKPDQLYSLYARLGSPVMKEVAKMVGLPAAGVLLGSEVMRTLNK